VKSSTILTCPRSAAIPVALRVADPLCPNGRDEAAPLHVRFRVGGRPRGVQDLLAVSPVRRCPSISSHRTNPAQHHGPPPQELWGPLPFRHARHWFGPVERSSRSLHDPPPPATS